MWGRAFTNLCVLASVVFVSACTAGPIEVVDNRLMRNLVAHWTLDESTGSRAADSSGNGHDGTVTGATWIAGQFGGALHFEQGNNQVQVPVFPQAKTDWTVALWVRPAAGDFGVNYVTLVSTEEVYVGGWQMNAVLSAAAELYQFGYFLGPADSDYYTYDCSCVQRGQWTHLAAVVQGATANLSFYRDGRFQGQAVAPSTATSGPIKPGSSTLYMGQWARNDRPFKGDLDDILIYDRALSDPEIAALAQGPARSGP